MLPDVETFSMLKVHHYKPIYKNSAFQQLFPLRCQKSSNLTGLLYFLIWWNMM